MLLDFLKKPNNEKKTMLPTTYLPFQEFQEVISRPCHLQGRPYKKRKSVYVLDKEIKKEHTYTCLKS
jgi:hypothetical protein